MPKPTVAVFSTKPYDRAFLDAANAAAPGGPVFEPRYLEPQLTAATAALAAGCPAVCGFVHDHFDRDVLATLAAGGTRSSRCAAPASTTSTSPPPPSRASRSCASRRIRRTRWPSTPSP